MGRVGAAVKVHGSEQDTPDVINNFVNRGLRDLRQRLPFIRFWLGERFDLGDVQLIQLVAHSLGVGFEVRGRHITKLFATPRARERRVIKDVVQTEPLTDSRTALNMEFEVVVGTRGDSHVDVRLSDCLCVFITGTVVKILSFDEATTTASICLAVVALRSGSSVDSDRSKSRPILGLTSMTPPDTFE